MTLWAGQALEPLLLRIRARSSVLRVSMFRVGLPHLHQAKVWVMAVLAELGECMGHLLLVLVPIPHRFQHIFRHIIHLETCLLLLRLQVCLDLQEPRDRRHLLLLPRTRTHISMYSRAMDNPAHPRPTNRFSNARHNTAITDTA